MAWTPTEFLLRGLLDNRVPGRVRGWLKVAGIPLLILVSLDGDLGDGIRGQRVMLAGPGHPRDGRAARCMAGFALQQTGTVTRMTAGRAPSAGRAHFEWHSDVNGPVILDLDPSQVHVVGEPSLYRPGRIPIIPRLLSAVDRRLPT